MFREHHEADEREKVDSVMLIDRERAYKIVHERNAVQRKIAAFLYPAMQRFGFHITADHFYDITPNTELIDRTYDYDERKVAFQIDGKKIAREFCEIVSTHCDDYKKHKSTFGYDENNYYFRGIDALFYYAFLRKTAARRIIEVGQGSSTQVALAALTQNAVEGVEKPILVSIDPHARLELSEYPDKVEFRTIRETLQERVGYILENLSRSDLLFIDSSHVFKHRSDVRTLFEEVLPFIQPNAVVHFHDIFSPFDYPKSWMVRHRRFWNEQYYLENFLAINESFSVVFPVHYLLRTCWEVKALLKREMEGGDDSGSDLGSSFYIARVK